MTTLHWAIEVTVRHWAREQPPHSTGQWGSHHTALGYGAVATLHLVTQAGDELAQQEGRSAVGALAAMLRQQPRDARLTTELGAARAEAGGLWGFI